MAVKTERFEIKTKGNDDIINITDQVAEKVRNSGITNGVAIIFLSGSTVGITTIEYEGRLLSDLRETLEKLVPRNASYRHSGNPFSHLRSALFGTSLSIPFVNKELQLGTWQQIVLIDFDNRPRERKILIQIIGE